MVKLTDKKGWLRIIEATIGIMLILGAALIFYQSSGQKSSEDLSLLLPPLADQIAKNITIREAILNLNMESSTDALTLQNQISEFMSNQVKRGDLSYASSICFLNDTCPVPLVASGANKELSSYQRIISATLDNPSSDFNSEARKLRIYIWKS